MNSNSETFVYLAILIVILSLASLRWWKGKNKNVPRELKYDEIRLVHQLMAKLPLEKKLLDDMILFCEKDPEVLFFLDKYPTQDTDEYRARFCGYLIRACVESGGEIEAVTVSQEFVDAHRIAIQSWPPKFSACYATSRSVYRMDPFSAFLSQREAGSEPLTRSALRAHQEELLSWSEIFLSHLSLREFTNKTNQLLFGVISKQITFRFSRKDIWKTRKNTQGIPPEYAK